MAGLNRHTELELAYIGMAYVVMAHIVMGGDVGGRNRRTELELHAQHAGNGSVEGLDGERSFGDGRSKVPSTSQDMSLGMALDMSLGMALDISLGMSMDMS